MRFRLGVRKTFSPLRAAQLWSRGHEASPSSEVFKRQLDEVWADNSWPCSMQGVGPGLPGVPSSLDQPVTPRTTAAVQPQIDQPQQTSAWLSGDSSCWGQREGNGLQAHGLRKAFHTVLQGKYLPIGKGAASTKPDELQHTAVSRTCGGGGLRRSHGLTLSGFPSPAQARLQELARMPIGDTKLGSVPTKSLGWVQSVGHLRHQGRRWDWGKVVCWGQSNVSVQRWAQARGAMP